jgi:hypothetical protein
MEEDAVRTALTNYLKEFKGTIPPSVEKVVIREGYAAAAWQIRHPSGIAILRRNATTGVWSMVTGGGGRPSVEELASRGVPSAIATSLLSHF